MTEIRENAIDTVIVDTAPQDRIVDRTQLDTIRVSDTQYIIKNLGLNSLEFSPSDGEFVYNENKAIYSGIFTYTVEGQTTPKQASGEITLNISSGSGISISEDLTDNNLVISLNAETISAIQSISTLQTQISTLQSGKVDKVAGKGLSTEDFTTAEKSKLAGLENYDDTSITNRVIALEADVSDIEALIPAQATTSNQLADKEFVNSSVSTATATFRGTYNSLQDLLDYSGAKDLNDYAFVITTDVQGNTAYNRYKYDGTQWVYEYTLNNSSFTASQWAAINSGATTANIGQIATNTNDISAINTTLGGYGDVVTHDADEFATALQGAKADTAVQPSDLSTVATSGSYNDLSNTPTIPTVNNPTITITQGGVTKGSFTLNQSTAETIALDAGGGGGSSTDVQVDGTSQVVNGVANLATINGDYDASTNPLATENDLLNIRKRWTFGGGVRSFENWSNAIVLDFKCEQAGTYSYKFISYKKQSNGSGGFYLGILNNWSDLTSSGFNSWFPNANFKWSRALEDTKVDASGTFTANAGEHLLVFFGASTSGIDGAFSIIIEV